MIGPNIDSFEEQDKNYDISLFNPKNDKEKINEVANRSPHHIRVKIHNKN